ncbi:DUF547 domain-containing protein [Roseofilum casamattae]|nr:DUF547 domain-containing protein [Roseofilum casamattae]
MKLKHSFLLVALPSLLVLGSCAGSPSSTTNSAQPTSEVAQNNTAGVEFSNETYAGVLSSYVNAQGLVNYSELQTNRAALDRYNAALGNVSTSTYESWSEAEQIAFWTNAYNSLTLQSIIDQNPLKKSIRDISGVWKGRKFPIVETNKTLDNIEHKTLRVDFDEPRIHMALVCAAISCPILRNEPYTGDRLDEQLDDQTRIFLGSSQGLKIDRQANEVHLSSIFKWFGEDWENKYGAGTDDKFAGNSKERAVLNFVSQYVSAEDRDYLIAGDYKVKYLNYDWSLNKQS